MLFIVLRKILNNKWLVACLLAGSILAVAMVSSIPMYTNGILQRMLTKDLELYQSSNKTYPGNYTFELNLTSFYAAEKRAGTFRWFNRKIADEMAGQLNYDIARKITKLSWQYQAIVPVGGSIADTKKRMTAAAYSDYLDHVAMTQGRLPSSKPADDGVVEVIASAAAVKRFGLTLNNTYQMMDASRTDGKFLTIQLVGIFEPSSKVDPWWYEGFDTFDDTLLIDYSLFRNTLISDYMGPTTANWCLQIRTPSFKVEGLRSFLDTVETHRRWTRTYSGISLDLPCHPILEGYFSRESELRATLWVLQVPILLMLAFYIFMVAQMIIQNDENEIALLKSRGGSKGQVFLSYLLQSALLSGGSVIVGPFLAMLICRILGASNGFLEFVGRTALPIKLNLQVFLYALLAGVFSVIVMMVPAIAASRSSITQVKQKKARRWNAPLWQKIFLDFILLGISAYGLYSFKNQQEIMALANATATDAPVNPLIYIMSTLFVLGAGLLFLRVYPYLIRLVFWLGRKFWSPVLYSSFIQVGRSGGRETFLMLFLILTLSVGVFSANSARTINQNLSDRISYEVGADIRFKLVWNSNQVVVTGGIPGTGGGAETATVVIYEEPNFDQVTNLPGITDAAKMLRKVDLPVTSTSFPDTVPSTLLAIDPYTFGKVTWSRDSLLPYHINEYLNLMTEGKNAVLLSSAYKYLGIAKGDIITVTQWGQRADFVVYGFVDYWPSVNSQAEKYFAVCNMRYYNSRFIVEPYEYWLARDAETSSADIYAALKEKKVQLSSFQDARQLIIAAKNDPLIQGTNGAMTMGFVVTMAISLIGFIIYWVLSIRARTLQFGIFRAMGMTKAKVMLILVCEQLMISVVAVLVGMVIGSITSELFVPLLEMMYSATENVPPFMVVAERADYLKIYSVVALMLGAGIAILGVLISRIKMAQAIKLGED
ncbi:MAG: ABC transporter permease [Christensenellales bacterium]